MESRKDFGCLWPGVFNPSDVSRSRNDVRLDESHNGSSRMWFSALMCSFAAIPMPFPANVPFPGAGIVVPETPTPKLPKVSRKGVNALARIDGVTGVQAKFNKVWKPVAGVELQTPTIGKQYLNDDGSERAIDRIRFSEYLGVNHQIRALPSVIDPTQRAYPKGFYTVMKSVCGPDEFFAALSQAAYGSPQQAMQVKDGLRAALRESSSFGSSTTSSCTVLEDFLSSLYESAIVTSQTKKPTASELVAGFLEWRLYRLVSAMNPSDENNMENSEKDLILIGRALASDPQGRRIDQFLLGKGGDVLSGIISAGVNSSAVANRSIVHSVSDLRQESIFAQNSIQKANAITYRALSSREAADYYETSLVPKTFAVDEWRQVIDEICRFCFQQINNLRSELASNKHSDAAVLVKCAETQDSIFRHFSGRFANDSVKVCLARHVGASFVVSLLTSWIQSDIAKISAKKISEDNALYLFLTHLSKSSHVKCFKFLLGLFVSATRHGVVLHVCDKSFLIYPNQTRMDPNPEKNCRILQLHEHEHGRIEGVRWSSEFLAALGSQNRLPDPSDFTSGLVTKSHLDAAGFQLSRMSCSEFMQS